MGTGATTVAAITVTATTAAATAAVIAEVIMADTMEIIAAALMAAGTPAGLGQLLLIGAAVGKEAEVAVVTPAVSTTSVLRQAVSTAEAVAVLIAKPSIQVKRKRLKT